MTKRTKKFIPTQSAITRRNFFYGLGALQLSITLPQQSMAQTSNSKLILEVLAEVYKKIQPAIEWIDWSRNAIPDLISKKNPSAPNGRCKESLSAPIDQTMALVQKIETSPPMFTLPDYSDVSTVSIRATRESLSSKLALIAEGINYLQDLQIIEASLHTISLEVNPRIYVLVDLQDLFLKISAVPQLYLDALQCWSAIDSLYVPKLQELDRAINQKAEEANKAAAKMRSALADSLNDHRNYLAAEALALQVEIDAQNAEQNKIEQMELRLKNIVEEMSRATAKTTDLNAVIAAARLDIDTFRSEIIEAKRSIDRAQAEVDRNVAFLSRQFTLCRAGYPDAEVCRSDSDCTYKTERARFLSGWDNENRVARDRMNRENERVTRLNGRIVNLENSIQDYEGAIEKNSLELERLRTLLARLEEDRVETSSDLTSNRRQLRERRAQNPAEAYIQINENERTMVETYAL